MREILGSGAEATVYLDIDAVADSDSSGSAGHSRSSGSSTKIIKERSQKNYRHPDIDSALRKSRTRKEAKILKSLETSGFTPKIIRQDEHNIVMEHIDGKQLKFLLDKKPSLASLIGQNLAYLHDRNIIHGDLTTSNMLLVKDRLYFIDFGLGFSSTRIEDKAVDIHLFRQALESKHFRVFDKAYSYFLKGYDPKEKKAILERLEDVEQRGRYKEKT